MLNPEKMREIVRGQVAKILDTSPHIKVFEDRRPLEIVRFETCSSLINRAKEAATEAFEFTEAAAQTYFKENTDKKIRFNLGQAEYEMYYFNGVDSGRPELVKEDFYLIKNGQEKISMYKFWLDGKNLNAHISYSDDPLSGFKIRKYYGDVKAEEECDRLITELEFASG